MYVPSTYLKKVTDGYAHGTFRSPIFAVMGKKAAKRIRKTNFPLVFWEGLKGRAEAAAEVESGGNLTTFVNTAVKKAVEAFERSKPKGK